jgi:PAS domain S-box-containing protein
MEEVIQIPAQLFAELLAGLKSLEAEAAIQHAALVELQDSLEKQGVIAAELRQELAEQEAIRQAVEAERQQYQCLFTLAPDGYLVTNTIGVIHEANPEAARLLGLPRTHLIGKPLVGFMAREEAQRFHTLLHALHLGPPSGQAWVGDFHPPRGQPFVGELTVAMRQDVSSNGTWYHWLLRDITARVRAEAALRQALAERQHLEREAQRAEHFAMLGRLAAGMAHEIRNPLGAVMLHVELLEEELCASAPDSPEELAQLLTEVKTNLARLDGLVQDYLLLVRMAPLARTLHDLGAYVQAWATEWQELVAACGVALRLDGLECLGTAAFHPNSLRRALLNLVQNALEAMPKGGALTITGQRTANQVQLRVQDTGSGMPVTQLPKIFEPLYTTKPGGTGLGLYIVQEVMAAHEGQVTVESVERQGTTFTITLPVAPGGPAQGEP